MIRIIKMMLILALALPLKGQQEVLDTYVEMGLKNNSEMLQKRLDRDMAASRYNEALGMYLPKIDINARYSVADGGRNIDIPLGDIMNPIVNVLNADLPDANKIPLYENQSIPFLREKEHETKISLFQPIIHPAIFFNIQSQADRQKSCGLCRTRLCPAIGIRNQSGLFQLFAGKSLQRDRGPKQKACGRSRQSQSAPF
jgi:hypothetical protein